MSAYGLIMPYAATGGLADPFQLILEGANAVTGAEIKWNGKPRLDCVDGQHLHSQTPLVLLWTCRIEGMPNDQADRLAGRKR